MNQILDPDLLQRLTVDGAGAGPSILPLQAQGLGYAINGRKLVDIPSLEIAPGAPTLILGPNGAGKSLLLRLLHGLIAPHTGTVIWNGARADDSIRRRQAMVFQRPVLLRRSAAANIGYALKVHGIGRAERPRHIATALEAAGLSHLAQQPARTLSGGEQQRLALARALAVTPQVLFLDEPTASLDPASTHAIEMLIARASAHGTKIIMVTHDIGQARRLAADIIFMHRGRITERGAAAPFFDLPASQSAREFLAGGLVL